MKLWNSYLRTALCIIIIVGGVAGIAILGNHRESMIGGCGYSDWSSPEFVRALRWGGILKEPEVAGNDSHQFVIGNDIPTSEVPVGRDALAVLRLPNRNLGPPPGDGLFVYPRAVVDEDGTLHMVWGEPRQLPGDNSWGSWNISSLRYAYYVGEQWSEAIELLAGASIEWDAIGRVMALDSAGRLHVIVNARSGIADESGVETHHLIGGPDGWHNNQIEMEDWEHWADYPNLMAGGSDSLYLVYVAASGQADPNSVYVRRSTDGGRTWSRPERIYASGGRRAFDVRLLRSRNDALHLIWREDASASTVEATGFRHTMSADGGRTWSELEDVSVADPIVTYDAVIDRCGSIHIVSDVMKAGEEKELLVRLMYLKWQDGWSEPAPLFPEMAQALSPGLGLDSRGNPVLYFSGGRESETNDRGQIGGFLSHIITRD